MGGDRDTFAMGREVVNPCAQAQHDIGHGRDRLEQGGLQVAAVDDPIRRAIALLGGSAERPPREHAAAARTRHGELFGSRDMGFQPRVQAQANEDARSVR